MRQAVRILPVLLLIPFAVFFNANLFTVRISELNYLLEDASGAQKVMDSTAILGKFELLKRRLEEGESRVDTYALEARIQALTAPRGARASDFPAAVAPFVRPLRAFLNGVRYVMGKEPIHPESKDATLGALEVAYLHERSRSYRAALNEYLRVLPEIPLGTNLRVTILLHVAFCDSMLNSMDNARVILTDVISENPGKEQSVVAWRLLGFLDLLDEKRSAGLPGTPTDLEKARQAYLLVDYATSIELLTGFIVRHRNDSRLPEAYFFRGRSHEELGEIIPAIDDYRTVVSRPGGGTWRREAQRRLFLLGTVYGQGEKVPREVMENGEVSPGAAFMSAVMPYARIVDPSSVAAWLTGSRAVAVVPSASPPAPMEPVGMPVAEPVADLVDEPVEVAVAPSRPAPDEPETPAPVALSTDDLFLPPLRLTPNPEPASIPILESTLPGSPAVALLAERTALARRHEREIAVRRSYNVGSWVSLGAGVASTGTMGYFLYQAFASYAQYKGATSAAQAQAMREQTIYNTTIATAAGIVGGVALATALTLQLFAPPTGAIEDRIRRLDEAIDQLGQR